MRWISRRWARIRVWFPRLRDTFAVLVCLLVAADTVYWRFDRGAPQAIVEGALCVGIGLSLWWRRRYALEITIIAVAITLVTGVMAAALVALATLTVRRRDRVTLLLVVATIVAFVAGQRLTLLHSPTSDVNLVSDVINTTLSVGFIVAAAAYIGARRDLVTSLQERAERAEAEREVREERGRLNERTRIAREMHDVLAHKVTLIALQAGGLEVTSNPSSDTVRDTAALIRRTARQALEDLRDVLGVLRDENGDMRAQLAPQATLADIASLVDSSRQAGLVITVTGSADLSQPIADLVGRAAFRLVQEALTNVHKHARNAATTLRIDGSPGGVLDIDVINRQPVGSGQLLPGSGMGLVGLRERVELAGGTFTAGPTGEGGFRMHASLPWPVDELAVQPVAPG